MDVLYTLIENITKENKTTLQHNAGRCILDYAAENLYGIKNSEIEIINKKPQFKYSKKHFSISHSNNIVIVGFDDFPIGIDIEYIQTRDFKSISERMKFTLEKNSLEEFYKVWTQYEAKYKLGIDTKYCKSQEFLSDYIMSIASIREIKDLNISQINI